MDHDQLVDVFAWVGRTVAAAALFLGAIWWSGTANFAGLTYCEAHALEFCDGIGAEKLAPYVLWPFTFVASAVVVAGATLTAPSPRRRRFIWASMIGTSVLAANRNAWIFAIATALGAVAIIHSAGASGGTGAQQTS